MLAHYQSSLQAMAGDTPPARLAILLAIPAGVILLWLRRLRIMSMWKVPGPWYLKLTTAFVKYHEFTGHKTAWAYELHIKYGPVVQLGRNEVSFASFTATKQIYNTGNRDFMKTEIYHLFEQDGHMYVPRRAIDAKWQPPTKSVAETSSQHSMPASTAKFGGNWQIGIPTPLCSSRIYCRKSPSVPMLSPRCAQAPTLPTYT